MIRSGCLVWVICDNFCAMDKGRVMKGPSLVHRSASLAGQAIRTRIPFLNFLTLGGVFLSRPVLHITQPAERRRVEVYSGFPLPISLRPFLLADTEQCVQCVSVVLLLVRLRTFVHIGSFLSLASIIVSRYLLQHLPLPIISRHRLPKTLLPRYFVL